MTVHVYPLNDLVSHDIDSGGDCVCGPEVEYINPDTGVTYEQGPVIVHFSLDGREKAE